LKHISISTCVIQVSFGKMSLTYFRGLKWY